MADEPDPPPGYVTRAECANISSGIREQLTGIDQKLNGILQLNIRVAVLEERDKRREGEAQDQKVEKRNWKKAILLVLVGALSSSSVGFIFWLIEWIIGRR